MFKVAPEGVEVTAISFDPTKRRLITGTRDGTVKIWNFNNGACLQELQAPDDSEVDVILRIMPKYLLVSLAPSFSLGRLQSPTSLF